MTAADGNPGPRVPGGAQAVIDELVAVVNSDPVRRFLNALSGIPDAERVEILDRVLTGPPSTRVDLGLPSGLEVRRRLFGGPDAEFAISKREKHSGALVTIFVTLSPASEPVIKRVLPWAQETN